MKINILVGANEVGRALRRYKVYVMGIRQGECRIMIFGEGSGLSQDNLNADLWIIEAWHPFEPDNPEGFRTAHKLYEKSSNTKCLLFFLQVPEGFPVEGSFWCNPVTAKLSDKIKEVLDNPPPSKADFDRLIHLWPALAQEPSKHHHHGSQ